MDTLSSMGSPHGVDSGSAQWILTLRVYTTLPFLGQISFVFWARFEGYHRACYNEPVAPIAQRTERCPPEAEALVRVQVGVPDWTHLEPQHEAVEQFLAMLRFEQRDKPAELPELLSAWSSHSMAAGGPVEPIAGGIP